MRFTETLLAITVVLVIAPTLEAQCSDGSCAMRPVQAATERVSSNSSRRQRRPLLQRFRARRAARLEARYSRAASHYSRAASRYSAPQKTPEPMSEVIESMVFPKVTKMTFPSSTTLLASL